jgi:hypothetical protein
VRTPHIRAGKRRIVEDRAKFQGFASWHDIAGQGLALKRLFAADQARVDHWLHHANAVPCPILDDV